MSFRHSILTVSAIGLMAASCTVPEKIETAASNVRILDGCGNEPDAAGRLEKEDGRYVQTLRTEFGDITLSYSLLDNIDAVLLDCSFNAAKDIDSLSTELTFYSIPADSVQGRYCLPFSLPYLRSRELNVIPDRYISNAETNSNTFSLITKDETFSVSIVPDEKRMNTRYDNSEADDYAVAMYQGEGTVKFRGMFGKNLKAGEPVSRRFLISSRKNAPGCFETGYHIGEYMNLVHYPYDINLDTLYARSMAYILHNEYAYGKISEDGASEFFGSVHSGTGEPFGNGNAVYAMYGNSFSLAALNQYLAIHPDDCAARERLSSVEKILFGTDIRTPEGAFWSMLDLASGKGYVDQAYRKWLETHATAWITYYILEAYETNGSPGYRKEAEKSLAWLLSKQRADGSLPKYFENGEPSSESLGDIAWAALAFEKAAELGLGEEYKTAALNALDWMEKNVVEARLYCGSFEDVGGVNDSYCPSVTARAFISAFRLTGDNHFLDMARKALSVSLAWISTGYAATDEDSYDESLRFKPGYAQFESVTCYYPCSYTLPMMYLACTELGKLTADNPRESAYWLGIADNFIGVSDFMIDGTKCRYGMQWLPEPFLVFSEWGNLQLCWAIMKSQFVSSPADGAGEVALVSLK